MRYNMNPSSMPITLIALFISVASSHAAILKGPYLQDVTPSSIRVFWETDAGSDSRVDYGPTASYGSYIAGDYSMYIPSSGTYLHDVPLAGLTPDTIYHYQVTTGATSSADHTFPTAIAPDTSFFRFVFYGDTQAGDTLTPDESVQEAIAEGILNSSPMFVIFTGDAVFRGNNYAMWGCQFFTPLASMLYSVPLFFVVGNHELGDPFLPATFFYWPYNPGTWYSFDYGNAHFTIVDTDADFSPGSAQYEWLVSDLAGASNTWLFVSFHHPPYTSSLSEFHPVQTAVQQILVPLFENYGVDMVLNSHVHWYERSEKNGIYYITSGGGGAELDTTQDTINPYQQYWASTYNFCTVDVSAEELLFKARYADGTPFDEVYVGHPPMLRMTVNPYPTSIGSRIAIEASVQPINNTFDALVVILFPDGRVYSMLPRKGLRQGAIPLAQNVHGLAAATDITLLSTVIPHGVPVGSYTVAAGLFPHGTVPRSLADAQAKAFPGYFSSETIQINQ
jgi:hypothetical protein